MEKTKKRIGILLIIGIVVLLASFNTMIRFVTDYQWFREVGYDQVFLTKLKTQLKIGIPLFLVLTIFIYFYLQTIKKDYYRKVHTVYHGLDEKVINRIALAGAAFVSFITSATFAGNLWFELLTFLHGVPFGIADPIFGRDISFYMFQYPFIGQIYSTFISFIILLTVITLVFYIAMMGLRRPTLFDVKYAPEDAKTQTGFHMENGKKLMHIALRQLLILGFIFFITLGLGYFLKIFELLYSPRGVAYGASFTDIHVTLWVYRFLTGLSFLSAILLPVGVQRKKLRVALAGPMMMIAIGILGNFVELGVQNFIVSPDEISKERQYLEYNIQYTKMAYGLENIEEKNFSADQELTAEDIKENRETIENIRINDYRPTRQFYNQRQGIRPYYQFHDVDIDRYIIDGEYRQVFLAAREIDTKKVNEQWINRHLKYTHGYGAVLSPVNRITAEGQPQLLIRNIPPESDAEGLHIQRPEIYFGELTDTYVITNTKEKEFDYPKGDENAETIYQGKGGISLKGFNKLLYALRQGSFKMLVSGNVTGESRILMYRNIHERVRKIAPFIYYDEDPYLVIDQGRLFWVIDGYTISSNYPYAQPFIGEKGNYIRNAVKVVIDAYHGTTTYYIADERDPVVQTLRKIFPQLFTSMDQMPEGIKDHIRYPQELFDIQANVYRLYHMTNPEVFYLKEDLWDIANELYERKEQVMESSYMVMKLPGMEKEEFVLSIPYTPKGKPNMTALLVARNDGENYGKLIVYKLPKQKNIYGPMQIETKINQDPNISKEFSLWGQQGSTYIHGNLLTIPIENALIYVEPIYLKADNENSLPEVKRVIVAYGDRIAYEETLEAALNKLFGTDFGKPEGPKTPAPAPVIEGEPQHVRELIIKANEIFQRAQEAQRAGNWADYGKYIDELERTLERLHQLETAEE